MEPLTRNEWMMMGGMIVLAAMCVVLTISARSSGYAAGERFGSVGEFLAINQTSCLINVNSSTGRATRTSGCYGRIGMEVDNAPIVPLDMQMLSGIDCSTYSGYNVTRNTSINLCYNNQGWILRNVRGKVPGTTPTNVIYRTFEDNYTLVLNVTSVVNPNAN